MAVAKIANQVIAVDFDGTCVEHVYPRVGQSAPHAVETMKELVENGNKLILWTMRSDKELKDAENWFKANGIVLYAVARNPTQDSWTSSPKCYASMYIDDLGFGCPMITPKGFNGSVVDWSIVKKELCGD